MFFIKALEKKVDLQAEHSNKRPHSDLSTGSKDEKKQKVELNWIASLQNTYIGKVKFVEKIFSNPSCGPEYECTVYIYNKIYSKERGKSKDVAKQMAAELAYKAVQRRIPVCFIMQVYSGKFVEKKVSNTSCDLEYECTVEIGNKIYSKESRKSKKEAKLMAAEVAIQNKSIEVLGLAGIIELKDKSDVDYHVFYCSVCLETIVCKVVLVDYVSLIRNHILLKDPSLVHLSKMVDLHFDDWNEVMKLLRGGKKGKNQDNLSKMYNEYKEVLRYVTEDKSFCLVCKKMLFISNEKHFYQHILSHNIIDSKEHKTLSYEQLKVKELEIEENSFKCELLKLSAL